VHGEGGLVQRRVVESDHLGPAVVDALIVEPADAPGRGLRDSLMVEEPRV
jgi:hypothetical protein